MVIISFLLLTLLTSCISTPTVADSTKLISEGKISLEDGYKLMVSQLYVLEQSEQSVKVKALSEKDNLYKLYKMKFPDQNSLTSQKNNEQTETKKIEKKSKDFYLRRKEK